jgi:hypothetical protein
MHQIYKGREKGSKVQGVKGFRERIMIVLRIIEILVLIILMNSVYSAIFNIKCASGFSRDSLKEPNLTYFNQLETSRPAILNKILKIMYQCKEPAYFILHNSYFILSIQLRSMARCNF